MTFQEEKQQYLTYLHELLQTCEIELTDNFQEAIFMIDDLMISGDFCDGIRGVDHNVLLNETFKTLEQISYYGIVLVPETETFFSNELSKYITEINGYIRTF